ncbi:MAG: hypothetical protein ABI234_07865 [Ktedonobacteraceae bacterium]
MIKSCEIEYSAETQLDLYCMPAHTLLEDDYFATVPVIAVRPALVEKRAIEEEMYTSFEEAISGRVATVSRQLSCLSRSETSVCLPALGDCAGKTSTRSSFLSTISARVRRFWQAQRCTITLLCLGLNLLLLGFDCMGVLVLAR